MKQFTLPLTLATLGLLSSCGVLLGSDYQMSAGKPQFETIDPEFHPYIGKFVENAQKYRGPSFAWGGIPVNFGKISAQGLVGVCHTYVGGEKEIIIREEYWRNASKEQRQSLFDHEAGHCRLDIKEHNDEEFIHNQKSYKKSLMNSFIVQGDRYKKYEKGYLTELFTSNSSQLEKMIIQN